MAETELPVVDLVAEPDPDPKEVDKDIDKGADKDSSKEISQEIDNEIDQQADIGIIKETETGHVNDVEIDTAIDKTVDEGTEIEINKESGQEIEAGLKPYAVEQEQDDANDMSKNVGHTRSKDNGLNFRYTDPPKTSKEREEISTLSLPVIVSF
jgi:hypothetical protein